MEKRYILAIDEGTSSARAGLFDTKAKEFVAMESAAIRQIYPSAGFVEEDANEIWKTVKKICLSCLAKSKVDPKQIYGIGITNQRESVVAFDRKSGKAIYNSIIWQCRRTVKRCSDLKKDEIKMIKEKTGLIADAYFSATKMEWILKNVPRAKTLLKQNRLCMGTIDSFLAFKLTGNFVTDVTNASRTMLFNINTQRYDDELLKLFNIPRETLPKVCDNDGDFGNTKIFGSVMPIISMIGDQQASLIGQACLQKGMTKATYGTGCFVLMNIGEEPVVCDSNIITTIAYKTKGMTTYAFEGSSFNCGSIINWLKDVKLIKNAGEIERAVQSVKDNGEVYLIPAFSGLGSPFWDGNIRASFLGICRGSKRGHLIRASLESIAFSVRAIIDEMNKHCFIANEMRCDGGVTYNDFLMHYQADLLGIDLKLSKDKEGTILGVALLCCLNVGVFKNIDEIGKLYKADSFIKPRINENLEKDYKKWLKGISLVKKF